MALGPCSADPALEKHPFLPPVCSLTTLGGVSKAARGSLCLWTPGYEPLRTPEDCTCKDVASPVGLLGEGETVGSCYSGPYLQPEPRGAGSECALQRGPLYIHVHTTCGHVSHSERCQVNHLPATPNWAENVHFSRLKRPSGAALPSVCVCVCVYVCVCPESPVKPFISAQASFQPPLGFHCLKCTEFFPRQTFAPECFASCIRPLNCGVGEDS